MINSDVRESINLGLAALRGGAKPTVETVTHTDKPVPAQTNLFMAQQTGSYQDEPGPLCASPFLLDTTQQVGYCQEQWCSGFLC